MSPGRRWLQALSSALSWPAPPLQVPPHSASRFLHGNTGDGCLSIFLPDPNAVHLSSVQSQDRADTLVWAVVFGRRTQPGDKLGKDSGWCSQAMGVAGVPGMSLK